MWLNSTLAAGGAACALVLGACVKELPFPENQCAFLEALDTSACDAPGGDCLKVVCSNLGERGGCPGAEYSVAVAVVDQAAVDGFVRECEGRGRCHNYQGQNANSCFGQDTGFWTGADLVLECYPRPCEYPRY